MTKEQMIKVIKNEMECVKRQDTPMCNRDECGCQGCDLILDADEVIKAYELILDALGGASNE